MRELLHSHVHEALAGRAEAFLREQCAQSEVLVIAPSRGAADDMVRRAASPGLTGAHRVTLTILAAQLAASRLRVGSKPASQLALEALTARSVEFCRRNKGIPYFEPVADTPGLARSVAATLREVRLEGVSVKELEPAGEPGRDLAVLAAQFDEELGELSDMAVILQTAAQAARDGAHSLLGLPVLWLGAALPSALHEELAAAVLKRAPHVLAVMPSDDKAGLERLSRASNCVPVEIRVAGHVAEALFEINPPAVELSVDFFSAAGEGLECVEIARRIHALSREGHRFDQVAVLVRSAERYQPLVEEAFRRAGIPAYFSRGVARPDPAGRAFLALLACAREDLSATRFAEYLSLGQVPRNQASTAPAAAILPDDELLAAFTSSGGAAPAFEETPEAEESRVVAPFAWERLLADAAVVGGYDRWKRRLRGLGNELQFQLAALERDEDERAPRVERQIAQLRALEDFALPIVETLDRLPDSARWGEWLDALADLASKTLSRPATVISVLSELRAMDEVGPIEIGEVYRVLADRLRFLRRDPPQARHGRVFVATIEEARGRSFDFVFLPGLSEGLFPRRAAEDPILLDIHREDVNQRLSRVKPLNRYLKTQDQRVDAERLLLYLAVGAAREQLIYSYPRMDSAQNRPRVPSFYALELLRATRGKLPDLRAFEREAAAKAPTRLDWPSPHDRYEAIDEAEFDLAVMRHAATLDAEETRGVANYLVEANAALARSLRTRGRRWMRKWFAADGIVDPGLAPILENHSLRARAYSPTALQHYAACPYRFALYAIHRLQPREEPAGLEQLDPLTRGEIFHRVQFELLGELRLRKLLPLSAQTIAPAIEVADEVLDRTARQFAEDLAPAIERVWDNDIEDLRTDMRAWLQDVAINAAGWIPAHFELSFGLEANASRDSASSADEAVLDGGYRVRGSIDLVERNAKSNAIRVTDHKTGQLPSPLPRCVGGGSVLQPVLYSAAAEKLLDARVESGRLYHCTRKGRFQDVSIPFDQTARLRLEQILETVDDAVTKGFLPAAPAKNACERCDYRVVCGPYEEIRIGRKPKDALAPLVALRRME